MFLNIAILLTPDHWLHSGLRRPFFPLQTRAAITDYAARRAAADAAFQSTDARLAEAEREKRTKQVCTAVADAS